MDKCGSQARIRTANHRQHGRCVLPVTLRDYAFRAGVRCLGLDYA